MGVDQTCGLTQLNIASGDEVYFAFLLLDNETSVRPISFLNEGTYCEDSGVGIVEDNLASRTTLNLLNTYLKDGSLTVYNRNSNKSFNSLHDVMEIFRFDGVDSIKLTYDYQDRQITSSVGFVMIHKFALNQGLEELEGSNFWAAKKHTKKNILDAIKSFLIYTEKIQEALPKIADIQEKISKIDKKNVKDIYELNSEIDELNYDLGGMMLREDSPWSATSMSLLQVLGSNEIVHEDSFKIHFDYIRANYSEDLIVSIAHGLYRFVATLRLFLILRKQWIPQGCQSQIETVIFQIGYTEKLLAGMKKMKEDGKERYS